MTNLEEGHTRVYLHSYIMFAELSGQYKYKLESVRILRFKTSDERQRKKKCTTRNTRNFEVLLVLLKKILQQMHKPGRDFETNCKMQTKIKLPRFLPPITI